MLWMVIQCGAAVVIGSVVFVGLSPYPENEKVPLFGALICGFFGSWAVMRLYVLIRHGWEAAKSMRWDGN